jgi:MFS transporter, DHA1 family, multidrug resistance protein
MKTNIQLSFFTLLLLISFASVNAVLFTPALPNIAGFFSISEMTTQQAMTWFLIGYALAWIFHQEIKNPF